MTLALRDSGPFGLRPKIIAVLILLVSAGVLPARAQEIVDVVKHVKVAIEDGGSAKQQLMDKAVEEASLESIQGLIGEEKLQRSRDTIQKKIIKDSGRYVLSVRGQNFARKGSEFEMDVEAKISLKNLRAVLLEHGLLYQMEGPPKVLPVVQITDRVGGRRFGWWYAAGSKEDAFLMNQLETLHGSLHGELQKIGFYAMSPLSGRLGKSVPEAYRGENLQRSDFLFLGEYFKSSVVAKGQVVFRLKPNAENVYMIDVRLEALHSGNGRLMAEVVRSYETDAGIFKSVVGRKFQEVSPRLAEDLSAQLADGWKRGTFGASVVKLAVVGKVSPLELEEFKKTVVIQVRDVKALRERLIEAGRTTFEVDSSALPQQLAQSFRSTNFAKFKVDVEDVSGEGLTLKVESR